MALAAEVEEVEMQRMVFEELELPVVQPAVIRENRKACQLFAVHGGNFNMTKHIEVRYHFVPISSPNYYHINPSSCFVHY